MMKIKYLYEETENVLMEWFQQTCKREYQPVLRQKALKTVTQVSINNYVESTVHRSLHTTVCYVHSHIWRK
jgi:hypothetical protein